MLRPLFGLCWALGWAALIAQTCWFQHSLALAVVTEHRHTLRPGMQKEHKDLASGQRLAARLGVPRI